MYSQIINKIPEEVQDFLVRTENNPILNAVPKPGNPLMKRLMDIWSEYVEHKTAGEYECPICLSDVLGNFKELLLEMVRARREANILKSV